MINNKMADAINAQINAEWYSSYLYISMAAYFDSTGLKGFSNWMRVQAQEEDFHAKKFFDYLLSRQGQVVLTSIDAPPIEWSSPLAAFEAVYEHEQKVTALIHALVGLAHEEKDFASVAMLQWFVTEQVEEEANADDLVQKLKRIGDNSGGLFMLDRELATRVFTAPAGADAP